MFVLFESGILGGALIGLAASLLLLVNGRIAGVSGVLGGLLGKDRRDAPWRIAFVLGLLAAGFAMHSLRPAFFASPPNVTPCNLIVAGLLVGFGTTLANGCTSGHGVCGVGRFSRRSVLATLVFILAGALTVWFVRAVAL